MKIKDAFEGYLKYRREMGMQPITMANDRKMLYGSFSHSISEREIMSLKMTDIADVIEAGRAHGEFGPQRSVSTLRKFFRYLEESGQETPFDWRDVEVPHVPRKINEYLTKDELQESPRIVRPHATPRTSHAGALRSTLCDRHENLRSPLARQKRH